MLPCAYAHFYTRPNSVIVGGGFKAIRSVLRYAFTIGPINLILAARSRNACKACAFGTGGQNRGYRNESGKGFELCNKNIQAQLSDIRAGIPANIFFEKSIPELSQLSGKQLEDLGRLTLPLYKKAGDSHYTPISYDQAIQLTAERLQNTQAERSFFYASGRSSNEAAFTLQLMARLYGTNNVNNCSYYCHQASGVGLSETVGTSTATVRFDDLDKADLIFVFGANPASNHPRFVKCLINARRRGANVVVVNPAKEAGMVKFASPSDLRSMLSGGSNVASHYVQPHLAGDLAFIQGISKSIVEDKQISAYFVENSCSGFDEFEANIRALSWKNIEDTSGVSKKEIKSIAALYANSKNTIFTWSMGLTHHTTGVANVEALAALAGLRGMIGKTGAGLLPLRGHSNIQGTGSMGFTPTLKHAIEEGIERELGDTLPRTKGLDTMACMEASSRGEIDAAIMLGGNLLASNPDTHFASNALSNIPFKCFFNTTINMSHVRGVDQEVIIFPVLARDEEKQATTQESMFNFVRLSDGGINRFEQLRSEIDIICSIAERVVDKSRFDFSIFRQHEKVREFVAKVIPGFEKLSNIDISKEEFHIDGRIHHKPKFNTHDGKIQLRFHAVDTDKKDELTLTTVRSEGQFNSIIFHEYDSYRGQTRRDIVLMNPKDMMKYKLKKDDRITLSTNTGELPNLSVKPYDIREGNAMTYYPEANVLVPKRTDNRSFTPAFKAISVKIEKQ